MAQFDLDFYGASVFDASIIENDSFNADMDAVIEVNISETYQGEYIVMPSLTEETVLRTNGLLMTDDVTVKEIPYYETTNQSGGTTVYIAMEVE